MNRLQRYYWTAKAVGWDNLPRRVLQALRVRSGWLSRKLDPKNFSDAAYRQSLSKNIDWIAKSKKFFTRPDEIELKRLANSQLWQEHVADVAQKIIGGDYIYFSKWYARTGWPVDFNYDPVSDTHWPTGKHWLAGDTLGGSDIKMLWEPNRFSAAYYFARQFARGGDMKWAENFWEFFDAWVEQNPPELTRNWACGQENVFRLMAMLFGAMVTLGSPFSTEKRLNALARLAWQMAKHVSININYARSQGNNHAISEAAGLIIVGAMFSEFGESKQWLSDGLKILEKELARQVMSDGSYAQHSMSYHRVVLDDLLWVCCVCEKNDIEVPQKILGRFEKMTNWLAAMVEPASGRVPNYGPNDGANILPLSCSDYCDYRPMLQACWWQLYRKNLFGPGPWDEKKLWLFGSESQLDEPGDFADQVKSFAAPTGGYYILRGPQSRLFTRCHSYHVRPTHDDMLHVDLWYKGKNILRDAGSYSYNAPQPWGDYFGSTAAHNTVLVNNADQMIKGPRFLWFEWTTSELERFCDNVFVGRHFGYKKRFGVTHERCCIREEDAYFIIDNITGPGEAELNELWRLCDDSWQVRRQSDGILDITNSEIVIRVEAPGLDAVLVSEQRDDDPQGWESLYYGQKNFCPHIMVSGKKSLPAKIKTTISPAERYESLPAIEKLLAHYGVKE